MLVVEDIEINRLALTSLFAEDFDVIEAENGKVALEKLKEYGEEISAILLDIVMPVMDGIEVLKEMNRTGDIASVPVVMITGESGDEKTLEVYQMGISDYINKPFNPDIVYRRVNNVVDLYAHRRNLEKKVREQKEVLDMQAKKLRESNQFVIDALSTTVEFRNVESGDHIKRMRLLTRIFLEASRMYYPLTDEEIIAISSASALHDIGKIAIPDSILLKPGKLTTEEFEIMKTHTTRGCDILESLNYTQDMQYYQYCYDICRHHHERWDGGGYPDRIAGDDISIWAQAASLADVYDALTSKRVYKDAYSRKQAVEMILGGECGVFNPKLIESFMKIQATLGERMHALLADETH